MKLSITADELKQLLNASDTVTWCDSSYVVTEVLLSYTGIDLILTPAPVAAMATWKIGPDAPPEPQDMLFEDVKPRTVDFNQEPL